jgi:hypothetical protein
MSESQSLKYRRPIDPLLDRRSGDDRRKVHDIEFFKGGGIERRSGVESRQKEDHGVQSVMLAMLQRLPKTKSPVE